MARDSTATPLILWICAAVCAHYVIGQGGNEVAKAHDDTSFLSKMAYQARGKTRDADKIFELGAFAESEVKPDEPQAPAPPPKPAAEKKAEPPRPEEKKAEPAKKPEEKKVALVPAEKTKPLEQQPQKDQRIAVKQHVKPEQQDNPNAKFIADEANKVDKETVATQTAHDQDDPNPTPAGQHTDGPKDHQGDSQRTRIADSEERPGAKDRAPGDKGTEFDIQKDPAKAGAVAALTPRSSEPPRAAGDGRPPSQEAPKPQQDAPGGASKANAEVAQGATGWTFDPTRPGGTGAGNQGGPGSSSKPAGASKGGTTKWIGLGAQAAPGQVNLNLSHTGMVAAVGQDQLRKERVADGERRKSEHRGSFRASNFERWRSAIENYVATVKPGNQTALNAARVPFATYLNSIHNRIHPIFADSFLGSLDSLPPQHPLSNIRLVTKLEIIVTPKEGRVLKMGVVRPSGVTAFDIAALDSVQRASPFGPAPSTIVSTDGNVYLHWEFHRDEVFACSTMNAWPFLLNLPPQAPPAEPPPGLPRSPTEERGLPAPGNPNEIRHGAP